MFSIVPRSSLRLAGLVINNTKKSSRCNLSADARQAVTKEERAARRAARKERANTYLSSIGSGASAESSAATGKGVEASSGTGVGFDATRWGWYAAVLIPTAFIGWGVYDEDSPPAKLSRFIGLTDRFDEFAKPARTKLLPDWNQVSCMLHSFSM